MEPAQLERALEAKTKECERIQKEYDDFTESSHELEAELEKLLQDSERQVEKVEADLNRVRMEHHALLEKYERLSREHAESNTLLENRLIDASGVVMNQLYRCARRRLQ